MYTNPIIQLNLTTAAAESYGTHHNSKPLREEASPALGSVLLFHDLSDSLLICASIDFYLLLSETKYFWANYSG